MIAHSPQDLKPLFEATKTVQTYKLNAVKIFTQLKLNRRENQQPQHSCLTAVQQYNDIIRLRRRTMAPLSIGISVTHMVILGVIDSAENSVISSLFSICADGK